MDGEPEEPEPEAISDEEVDEAMACWQELAPAPFRTLLDAEPAGEDGEGDDVEPA